MYPFFESIRLLNGIAPDLNYHQARVNRTISDHRGAPIDLELLMQQEKQPAQGLHKWRVSYNTQGDTKSVIQVYTAHHPSKIKLMDADHIIYRYKYENREAIHQLLSKSGASDIFMIRKGLLTDASYANLAFFNGAEWHTPKTPMLEGTQRAKFIEQAVLIEKDIYVDQLSQYQSFKRINAMMNWDDSPELPISMLG
ncbi:MAG: aminotransferase class IV [Flavobacteriaceae bacterium]|nr:aminotransferase class IV [Flavobacteriaceae bacterium]